MREIDLKDLSSVDCNTKSPVLSIYLSKDVSLHDSKTLLERWKQLLLDAEFLLLKEYPRNFVDDYLQALNSVDLMLYVDELDEALALFYAKDKFEGSPVFVRLQSRVVDNAFLGDSFHLDPIKKVKNKSPGFFIVTMTSRAINVLIENKGHLVKIDSYRNEPGIDKKNKKDHHEFFLSASFELNKLFKAYRLPIVLAGVKTHLGAMRKLLNQSMLLEKAIIGNVEKMKTLELQKKVYQICE